MSLLIEYVSNSRYPRFSLVTIVLPLVSRSRREVTTLTLSVCSGSSMGASVTVTDDCFDPGFGYIPDISIINVGISGMTDIKPILSL